MSFAPVTTYPKSAYIETDTGNKVSRRATISGPQNIVLGGKSIISPSAVLRGDLRKAGSAPTVVITLGRYCLVGEGVVVRPPYKTYKGAFNFYPMKIGDGVHIGEGSVVEAAQIGSWVVIGRNCVIGKFAIIKDCARIADGTVLPPNTVVPALSLFAGSPGRFIEDLPETTQEVVEARTKAYYNRFQPAEQ
ncbi:putative dynactin Arp1 p25 subunit RO12 [Calocera cornea HHB12733]|uniref:Dynactin subunit 5 n=1 Tax=Calocera cornea HHB12733 TaxID=1353952 RepID=A0A165H035_9BASI|nr:putative dynactin Arp1 p25 subunit RO12 [Calocera cornea HHB12733]